MFFTQKIILAPFQVRSIIISRTNPLRQNDNQNLKHPNIHFRKANNEKEKKEKKVIL